jgi:hypothetical protein
MAKPTAQEIWATLSKIDCSKYTEEKMGLTYLSWSHAWRLMMEHYPDLQVKWHGTTDDQGVTRDVTYYNGGTAMVTCSVTIGDVKRDMWLPVMDYKMKSIANPDSRAVSDAKQRCLVKCFSLYGLANYLYSGDALPYEESSKPVAPKKSAPKKKSKSKVVPEPVVEAVEEPELDFVAELRTMANDLYQSGWEPDGKTTADIKAAIKGGDQEKAALLIKRLKDVGEVALKLDDAKAEEK